MDEDESEENSQTEAERGGPGSPELYSQTPPLPSSLEVQTDTTQRTEGEAASQSLSNDFYAKLGRGEVGRWIGRWV